MRKIILLCVLAIGMMADAQTVQTIAKALKLNIVASGTAADSVLVRGADKIVKFVPRSAFGGGSGGAEGLQQVLQNGNASTVSLKIKADEPAGEKFSTSIENNTIIIKSIYDEIGMQTFFGSNGISFAIKPTAQEYFYPLAQIAFEYNQDFTAQNGYLSLGDQNNNACILKPNPAMLTTGYFYFPLTEIGGQPKTLATTDDISNARPYKSYTAIMTQTGTNAPTAIVLENTLGENIAWSYESAGNFKGTKDTPFDGNKTFIVIGQTNFAGTGTLARVADFSGDNQVQLVSFFHSTGDANDLILSTSIEIRVYN